MSTSIEVNTINHQFAEFLGYSLITPAMRKHPENWVISYYEKPLTHEVLGTENNLKFHKSMRDLEKMRKKIQSLGFIVETNGEMCRIKYDKHISWTDAGDLVNSMYLEFYGFLKWYNQNKIDNGTN